MSGKPPRDFHHILEEHLLRSHIPLAVIAKQAGISRRTLHRWFVNTLPKNHLVLLKVLAFIRLSQGETNELLELAGFPSLKELRRAATTEIQAVLQAWPTSRPAPNQSMPSPNYFVGRRELIDDVKRYLLRPGGLRIFGLRGLGGVGKTTLAKRIAEDLESEFPDGILWAELHRSDAESILTQFAGDYGEDLTQYSGLASKASLVRSLLRHKRALIVLDNAENDAQLQYLLPPKSSTCAVLITSRKNLKTLRGWESCQIQGFDIKESLALLQYFLGKAKVKQYQSVLAQVTEQLGHLPLAVLILASYLQSQPDVLIERLPRILQDRRARLDLLHPEEDESVRLTFELSWDALSSERRQSLAFLSQFGGRKFSTAAASALWAVPLRQAKQRLGELVDCSLVEAGQADRWGLHPLIHDYLVEKMEIYYPAQRQPLTQHLVEHYTRTIQQSGTSGYRHLALDLDNIIHALDNSYQYRLWDLLARNSPAVLNLLETFGRYESIDHLSVKALTAAERLEDDPTLAALLYCIATIDTDGYMNYARAVERAKQGMEIARGMQDWALVCEFLFILARAAWAEGDAALEARYWDEIERIAVPRELPDILMRLARARAWRSLWNGDYAYAEKTLTDFIKYSKRLKKTKVLWQSLDYLAYVFYRKGDFKRADANYRKALDVAMEADGVRPVTVLLGCAQNAVAWGELDTAQTYADEALTLTQSVARPVDVLDTFIYAGDVSLARTEYKRARELWEKALHLARSSQARAKEYVTLARLGKLFMQEGNLLEADAFLLQALQLAEQYHQPSVTGYVYEQLAYLAAAKGQIQQAREYGQKCLEAYEQMRLREAVDFRKWLESL
jgi:tetratricopeptide (TPR) repeat protein